MSEFKSDYVRVTSYTKPFEPTNAAGHQFDGKHALDLNSGNTGSVDAGDLDTYTGVTGYSFEIPEGTPVVITPDGLRIMSASQIGGVEELSKVAYGYLHHSSKFYASTYRRDEFAYGKTSSPRTALKSDNIRFVRAHAFDAVWSYYHPKGVADQPTDFQAATEAQIGDLLVLRDQADVAQNISSGIYNGNLRGFRGIGNYMPPAVKVVAAAAQNDIVLGTVTHVRGLDSFEYSDTGIFTGDATIPADLNNSANYIGAEIEVKMLQVPVKDLTV